MAYVTVDDIKRYTNVTFCSDDLLFAELEETAESVLAGHLNVKSLDEYEDEEGNIPEALKTAVKAIVANIYSNRESIAYGQPYRIPYTLEFIIQPYKNYLKNNIEEL